MKKVVPGYAVTHLVVEIRFPFQDQFGRGVNVDGPLVVYGVPPTLPGPRDRGIPQGIQGTLQGDLLPRYNRCV